MKRQDPDVFAPPTFSVAPLGLDRTPGRPQPLPPAGPVSGWSARGVIRHLEPLLLPERRERLRDVLAHRLDSVTLVLDNPHDPHNGSAVTRSCDAFGVQNLHVLCEHEPFLASSQIAKGTQRWVDIHEHQAPAALAAWLHAEGYRLLVTHPEGRRELSDLARMDRVAIVLGNEHSGVGRVLTEAADDTLAIPMCGFVESLNMSVSAALCLHAATSGRQRGLSPEVAENTYARWLRVSVPRADDVLSALDAE